MANSTVGIIANPASGKDIRRLVSHGTVFDNQEKVNIVRRIILACDAVGIGRILYMPDYYGLVEHALDGLGSGVTLAAAVEPLPMELTATQADTPVAAALLARMGAGAVIVLGGDGTNRLAAKSCGAVPLLPVSTGTNNVFPSMLEGTTAGLAAAVAALGLAPGAIRRAKRLVVEKNGQDADMALIDAVVLREHFIGARAMWEVDNMEQAVLTTGGPHHIGIASILGCIRPLGADEPGGASLVFGPGGRLVTASIAPGLFKSVPVSSLEMIACGERVPVRPRSCIIALDGERELELGLDDSASIRLENDGPFVIDACAALRAAAEQGFFCGRGSCRAVPGEE